jgi:hypothetical protein
MTHIINDLVLINGMTWVVTAAVHSTKIGGKNRIKRILKNVVVSGAHLLLDINPGLILFRHVVV